MQNRKARPSVPPEILIRPAILSDVRAWRDLHSSCLTEALPAAPTEAPYHTLLALKNQICIGGISWMSLPDEVEILSLCVAPEFRQMGVATRLFHTLLASLTPLQKTIWLEVSVENTPAIALYQSLGFVKVRTRVGYYRTADGGLHDALVMRYST